MNQAPRSLPHLSQLEREAIADAYIGLAREYGTGQDLMKVLIEADNYKNCLKFRRVYHCQRCQHNYSLRFSCNSRMCDKCGRRIYVQLFESLYKELMPYWSHRAKTYGPKFLTLTFNHDRWKGRLPVKSDLTRCQREVREFVIRFYSKYKAKKSRNGNWYQSKTFRGAGSLAVVELAGDNHLHFHFLVYGPFITKEKLSQSWLNVTGDSYVIDIQDAKTPRDAVRYILKYISKPPAHVSIKSAAAWAWLLKGRRKMATYGVLFNRSGKPAKRDRPSLVCLFDGEQLSYRGLSLDPHKVLIDWIQWCAEIESGKLPYMKTWMDAGPWGSLNKNFEVSTHV
jgi:hypothetical protein